MPTLADRIRAAREDWVEAGGRKWLLRRPTVLEISQQVAAGAVRSDLVFSCIVGWELQELDLVPGGGGSVPPFDPEAFREWAADRLDLVAELADHVQEAITAFNDKLEAAGKN